jgi:hypothetical protein
MSDRARPSDESPKPHPVLPPPKAKQKRNKIIWDCNKNKIR